MYIWGFAECWADNTVVNEKNTFMVIKDIAFIWGYQKKKQNQDFSFG